MIIVSSYKSPDLDGVACSIGYSEYLNQTGTVAKAAFYGALGLEVNFVNNYTKILPIEEHAGKYDQNDEFILVDTDSPEAIDPNIPIDKVIKIYDHRQLTSVHKFVNAKSHVELVGSCATLITEKFIDANLVPTKVTAIYLYSAIVSNTINFKNSVTTSRDIECAQWLNKFINLDDKYIADMFNAKSVVTSDNLYQVLSGDFAVKMIADKRVGISQLEMVDIDRMDRDLNESLIKSLRQLQQESNTDLLLFTGIDVIKGYNYFYTIDDLSNSVFAKALGFTDLCPGYKSNFIIMRKQIWPKLESVLKSNNS